MIKIILDEYDRFGYIINITNEHKPKGQENMRLFISNPDNPTRIDLVEGPYKFTGRILDTDYNLVVMIGGNDLASFERTLREGAENLKDIYEIGRIQIIRNSNREIMLNVQRFPVIRHRIDTTDKENDIQIVVEELDNHVVLHTYNHRYLVESERWLSKHAPIHIEYNGKTFKNFKVEHIKDVVRQEKQRSGSCSFTIHFGHRVRLSGSI